MTHPRTCARLTLVTVLIATAGLILTAPGLRAQGATFVAEGDIDTSNPGSKTIGGATESDFASDCSYPPDSQGFDGWVFELPSDLALPAAATVTGESAAPYDLDSYFYTADCTLLDGDGDFNMATLSHDEEGTISATTRYVVVDAAAGANIHVVLCAGDLTGCGTSPSASTSATPDTSPSASSSATSDASPSPSSSPTDDPGVAHHPRSVRLRLSHARGNLRAKGRVRVTDGHEACHGNVPVALERRSNGKWVRLRVTQTNGEGGYRVRFKDRAGRYRAKALRYAHETAPHDVCEPATITKRHRH